MYPAELPVLELELPQPKSVGTNFRLVHGNGDLHLRFELLRSQNKTKDKYHATHNVPCKCSLWVDI